MSQDQYDNIKVLLDRWAEWVATGEPIAEGAPRECLGAPDARIHSFEDMEIEIEDNKWVRRLTSERMEPDGEARVVVTVTALATPQPQLALV